MKIDRVECIGLSTRTERNVALGERPQERGGLFYQKGPYHVTLAMNNLFDKTYFQSQYLFWDVFIKPSPLRTATLTASYNF